MEEMKGLADLGWFGNNPLDELAKIEQEIIERLKASGEWSSTPIARPTNEGENQ